MDRYIDVTERNFIALTADVQAMNVKLDTVDAKLAKIDARMERIERHLGIAPPPVPDPNAMRVLDPLPTGADPITGR